MTRKKSDPKKKKKSDARVRNTSNPFTLSKASLLKPSDGGNSNKDNNKKDLISKLFGESNDNDGDKAEEESISGTQPRDDDDILSITNSIDGYDIIAEQDDEEIIEAGGLYNNDDSGISGDDEIMVRPSHKEKQPVKKLWKARYRRTPIDTKITALDSKTNIPRTKDTEFPMEDVGYVPDLITILHNRVERAKNPVYGQQYHEKNIIMKHIVVSKHHRFLPLTRTMEYSNQGVKVKKRTLQERTSEFYLTETKSCCYWCTEPINDLPLPMAHAYREVKNKWWFDVSGQYCTPACSLAHVTSKKIKLSTTIFMFSKVYNFKSKCPETGKLRKMIPAPPPYLLKKFGGYMTIEEFRATGRLGIMAQFIQLPFLPMSIGIEEIERVTTTFKEELDDKKLKHIIEHGKQFNLKRPLVYTTENSMPTTRKRSFAHMSHRKTSHKQKKVNKPRKRKTSKNNINKSGGTSSYSTTKDQQDDNYIQEGRFASLPTIEEQLQYSSERLRLERKELKSLTQRKKQNMNLLKFMQLENT